MTVAPVVVATAQANDDPQRSLLPVRRLGGTGATVTMLGLGGEHVLSRENNDAAAEELVTRAFALGIKYFDTAEQYYPSEKYLGQALAGRRDQVFISTKVDSRDADEAQRKIERSLKLLRTDRVDNLNIHRVRNQRDVDRLTKKGGLLEVVQRAKEQGLTRFIGISGHYLPEPLIEMMRRAELDTVLLPVNAADAHYLPFREVITEARRHKMGVIAMKVCGRGRLFSECGFTEMDPLLRYALSQDVHVAIVGVDNLAQLEDNVRIAREFTPMTPAEQKALEERVRPHAQIATFYKQGSSGWLD
jgi:aryl-alcohol dehydrogenase-like predicted oxidoreductase